MIASYMLRFLKSVNIYSMTNILWLFLPNTTWNSQFLSSTMACNGWSFATSMTCSDWWLVVSITCNYWLIFLNMIHSGWWNTFSMTYSDWILSLAWLLESHCGFLLWLAMTGWVPPIWTSMDSCGFPLEWPLEDGEFPHVFTYSSHYSPSYSI